MTHEERIAQQERILKRLMEKTASPEDFKTADNVTRVRYANYLWPLKSDKEKCHLMFHTSKAFNGFDHGEKSEECELCHPTTKSL